MNKKSTNTQFRIVHRYLGFFLAGIMAVYAISGIILVFRNTDFLKTEKTREHQLEPNLTAKDLGPKLRLKVKDEKTEGDIVYFSYGQYNQKTGLATVTKEELPFVLEKMKHMHIATTDSPL